MTPEEEYEELEEILWNQLPDGNGSYCELRDVKEYWGPEAALQWWRGVLQK